MAGLLGPGPGEPNPPYGGSPVLHNLDAAGSRTFSPSGDNLSIHSPAYQTAFNTKPKGFSSVSSMSFNKTPPQGATASRSLLPMPQHTRAFNSPPSSSLLSSEAQQRMNKTFNPSPSFFNDNKTNKSPTSSIPSLMNLSVQRPGFGKTIANDSPSLSGFNPTSLWNSENPNVPITKEEFNLMTNSRMLTSSSLSGTSGFAGISRLGGDGGGVENPAALRSEPSKLRSSQPRSNASNVGESERERRGQTAGSRDRVVRIDTTTTKLLKREMPDLRDEIHKAKLDARSSARDRRSSRRRSRSRSRSRDRKRHRYLKRPASIETAPLPPPRHHH